MSLAALLDQFAVTIRTRTRTGLDSHGNPTAALTSTATRGWFSQADATEAPTVAGEDGLVTATLLLPAGTVLRQEDEIEVAGHVWQIDGTLAAPVTIRGESHVITRLKRTVRA